jgi:drug/metabolite transporter (DMT)-like permease
MPLLALTTLEKIQQVPPHVWWAIGLGILGIILIVMFVRHLMDGANKFLLAGIALLVGVLLCMQWVYERNEPAFLTPLVDSIAPFFPSKGGQPIARPPQ